MDARAIRMSFATFCGAEQYDKFIREMNTFGTREGRMRHWQEILWDRFAAINRGPSLAFTELQGVFRVCAIHGRDLSLSTNAEVERALEYEAALAHAHEVRSAQFIHAAGTWWCQDCWTAFLEWESRHPLTLAVFAQGEDYSMTQIAFADVDDDELSEWLACVSRVRAGDELWHLRSPEESWRALCGREYVALVRRGRIVSMRLIAMN